MDTDRPLTVEDLAVCREVSIATIYACATAIRANPAFASGDAAIGPARFIPWSIPAITLSRLEGRSWLESRMGLTLIDPSRSGAKPEGRSQAGRRHKAGTKVGAGSRSRLMERLLTLEEMAEYLRVTPGALCTQRYRREKQGALGVRVGRRVLYRPSDIDRILNERLSETELDSDR